MVQHFRRALLVWLWLCAAGIAGEISLRNTANVDHAVVRLGDVAEIYGLDDQKRTELLAIELLPSPASGQIKKISVREIQDAMARRAPEFAAWTIAGSNEVAVSRAVTRKARAAPPSQPKTISPVMGDRARNQIEEAILNYIRERLGDEAWDVEADLSEEQLAAVAAAHAVQVTGGRYVDAERVQFRIEVGAAEDRVTWKVTARVSLPPMIVVARRELTRGEMIAEQDVELVRAGEAQGLLEPFASLDDVVGKETTRAIAVGQPVTEPSVRATLLVRRGQVVTVYSRCGGVQIRTTGRAKEDGSHGALVPVEAIGSRAAFHARVSGPQEVEIYAASATTPALDDVPREPGPWLAERRETNGPAVSKSTPGWPQTK